MLYTHARTHTHTHTHTMCAPSENQNYSINRTTRRTNPSIYKAPLHSLVRAYDLNLYQQDIFKFQNWKAYVIRKLELPRISSIKWLWRLFLQCSRGGWIYVQKMPILAAQWFPLQIAFHPDPSRQTGAAQNPVTWGFIAYSALGSESTAVSSTQLESSGKFSMIKGSQHTPVHRALE